MKDVMRYDKFEAKCRVNWKSAYAQLNWKMFQHHERFVRFVNAMAHPLVCQECGGGGGETEVILDDGTGPWMGCGFCEGTGLMTPHMRGQWLLWKKQDKAKAA